MAALRLSAIDHTVEAYCDVPLVDFEQIIILFSGLHGIYIANIFSEVEQRPLAIVRHICRSRTGKDKAS